MNLAAIRIVTLLIVYLTLLDLAEALVIPSHTFPGFPAVLSLPLNTPRKVSHNIDKEVNLGQVAGPFSSPPLPLLQFHPIGVVPKNHT